MGASVDFNCHKFVLIDADEYAFRYMEKHFEKVSCQDVRCVLENLKSTTAWTAVSSPSGSTVYSFLHLSGVGRALWANSSEGSAQFPSELGHLALPINFIA